MADRVIVVHRSDVRSWRDNSASFDVEAVIPPSIAEVRLDVPAGVLTAVSAAERAMTELDTQLSHESTTAIEAATFALIRAESISSSRIEGLAVGSRRLAEAAHDPAIAKRLAREVASNVAALRHAIDLGSRRTPLGVDDILDIHSELMLRVPGVPAGEFRTVQSWIGRSNTPADAVYVPPPPDMVAALMDDLAEFLNRNDLPVVVQAAVAHAQFEAIHPFVDGNGRVGRCLVSVLLRRGATTEAIPPVSGVFASDTSAYFEALRQFQQEASPVPWLVQFAEATARACQVALTMTRDITELQAHWTRRAGNPRAGSIVARLIEVLPTMSVTDAAAVADRLGVDPNVARRGLNQLETAGILQTTAGRKRGRVWRAPEFHALLDAYSAGFSRTDPD